MECAHVWFLDAPGLEDRRLVLWVHWQTEVRRGIYRVLASVCIGCEHWLSSCYSMHGASWLSLPVLIIPNAWCRLIRHRCRPPTEEDPGSKKAEFYVADVEELPKTNTQAFFLSCFPMHPPAFFHKRCRRTGGAKSLKLFLLLLQFWEVGQCKDPVISPLHFCNL